MSDESLIAYVNGEYLPRDQARISIFDVGFLRGDAVFDTTSAWNGRIFKLSAHLERLELSLRAARIPCPLPLEELRGVIIGEPQVAARRPAARTSDRKGSRPHAQSRPHHR